MSVKKEAVDFFKGFIVAHRVFMSRPFDFTLSVLLVGLVLYGATNLLNVLFEGSGDSLLIYFFEQVLYLSILSMYFAYPVLNYIIGKCVNERRIDWFYEISTFFKSPLSKVFKAISGGFIFSLMMTSLIFFCLYLFSLFTGVPVLDKLIVAAPGNHFFYDSSMEFFAFIMLAISLVPANWLISNMFVKTFFPSEKAEIIYLRTTASVILILICLCFIFSLMSTLIPSELDIVNNVIGSVFLVYFVSLFAINDYKIRTKESGRDPHLSKF